MRTDIEVKELMDKYNVMPKSRQRTKISRIIRSKDGSEQAVLQKQVMPKIRGVLVVCDGGDDALTREKITKAVSSVLNISSGKVFVTA